MIQILLIKAQTVMMIDEKIENKCILKDTYYMGTVKKIITENSIKQGGSVGSALDQYSIKAKNT